MRRSNALRRPIRLFARLSLCVACCVAVASVRCSRCPCVVRLSLPLSVGASVVGCLASLSSLQVTRCRLAGLLGLVCRLSCLFVLSVRGTSFEREGQPMELCTVSSASAGLSGSV